MPSPECCRSEPELAPLWRLSERAAAPDFCLPIALRSSCAVRTWKRSVRDVLTGGPRRDNELYRTIQKDSAYDCAGYGILNVGGVVCDSLVRPIERLRPERRSRTAERLAILRA